MLIDLNKISKYNSIIIIILINNYYFTYFEDKVFLNKILFQIPYIL